MDPVSITLAQRLQAVVFRKHVRNNFSKLFHTTQKVDHAIEQSDEEQTQNDHEYLAQDHDVAETDNQDTQMDDAALDDQVVSDSPVEPSAFTPPNEQLLREEKYIFFQSDDPEDYTGGPPRLIHGDDGLQKECAALLLTYSLSQKMQAMVANGRKYAREERFMKDQTAAIRNFEGKIKREIASHQARIRLAETNPEYDPAFQLAASLEKELGILERMKSDMEDKKTQVERDLRIREKCYKQVQRDVTAMLEEAFMHAALIGDGDEEDIVVEDYDLQEEYQKTVDGLYNPDFDIQPGYSPPPSQLDISRDHLRRHVPESTPEQQAEDLERQQATEALDQAFEQLNTAEYQFEHREFSRDQDLQQCIEQEQRGEEIPYESREDFDLNWIRNFGEITRNLIEAEKAVAEAKKAAKAAGVKYTSAWQDSDYVDEYRPGYPLSQEIDSEQVQQAVMPAVESWLETVEHIDVEVPAEGQENLDSETVTESTSDLDEWSCQEVEIGDSLSCVDLDWHREQIDEWRRTCRGSE